MSDKTISVYYLPTYTDDTLFIERLDSAKVISRIITIYLYLKTGRFILRIRTFRDEEIVVGKYDFDFNAAYRLSIYFERRAVSVRWLRFKDAEYGFRFRTNIGLGIDFDSSRSSSEHGFVDTTYVKYTLFYVIEFDRCRGYIARMSTYTHHDTIYSNVTLRRPVDIIRTFYVLYIR